MTFGFFKYRRKESDRVLSKVVKVKLQKNFYNYLIKIVCFYSGLSFYLKINKNERKKKFTLQNIKNYKLDIIQLKSRRSILLYQIVKKSDNTIIFFNKHFIKVTEFKK